MTGSDGRDDEDFDAPRARPYTATKGRTEPQIHLDLAALVLNTGACHPDTLQFEHASALSLCGSPVSVAEVAARMAQPVVVARVLLSDLIRIGAVSSSQAPSDSLETQLLERVLIGLRNL